MGFSLMKSESVAQTVKNLPPMRKTWVQSLSQENTLEKEMATHSSIIVWRISWTEDRGGYSSWGCKESDMTEQLTHTHIYIIQPWERRKPYYLRQHEWTFMHQAKWNKPDRRRLILHAIIYIWNQKKRKVKLLETESRTVGWGMRKIGRGCKRIQTFSYERVNIWGSNV